MLRPGSSFLGIIYLIAGAVVAADRNYFAGINNIEQLVEAVLAVTLWPLVLLGIAMRF